MKVFFTIFLILILSGCSSIPTSSWKTPIYIKQNALLLEPGDILIKQKDFGFLEWFGHCGLLLDDFIVADFPKLGTGMHFFHISDWAHGNRKIMVLRVSNCSAEFKSALIENILQASDKNYKLVINKKDSSGYYCSQFIWEMYYRTALQFKLNIDIDSNKGIIVFPYDFYSSKYTEEVKF